MFTIKQILIILPAVLFFSCIQDCPENRTETKSNNEEYSHGVSTGMCGNKFGEYSKSDFKSIPKNRVKRVINWKLMEDIKEKALFDVNNYDIHTKTYQLDNDVYVFYCTYYKNDKTNYLAGFYVNNKTYTRSIENIVDFEYYSYEVEDGDYCVYGEYTCGRMGTEYFRMRFDLSSNKITVTIADLIPEW